MYIQTATLIIFQQHSCLTKKQVMRAKFMPLKKCWLHPKIISFTRMHDRVGMHHKDSFLFCFNHILLLLSTKTQESLLLQSNNFIFCLAISVKIFLKYYLI